MWQNSQISSVDDEHYIFVFAICEIGKTDEDAGTVVLFSISLACF